MTRAPYRGLYINLDSSQERRRELEEQLRMYGLSDRYTRLPATDGARIHFPRATIGPGEVGCFLSHYRALAEARAIGIAAHIIEDDIFLSEHLERFALEAEASGLFDTFDIVFTETHVHANPFTLRYFNEALEGAFDSNGDVRPNLNIRYFDVGLSELTGATSYFVGPKSIDKVLAVLKAELDAGPTVPLDFCYRNAAKRGLLKCACTLPFLTSIRFEHILNSTIPGRYESPESFDLKLQMLLRYSFFSGRDLKGYARRFLGELVSQSPRYDTHQQFVTEILGALVAGPRASVKAR